MMQTDLPDMCGRVTVCRIECTLREHAVVGVDGLRVRDGVERLKEDMRRAVSLVK